MHLLRRKLTYVEGGMVPPIQRYVHVLLLRTWVFVNVSKLSILEIILEYQGP